MADPILIVRPTPSQTRILLMQGNDECLKAILPPPLETRFRAAHTLLQGLSLWFQRPLCVVSSADDQESMFVLGLSDEAGVGKRTPHYQVRVLEGSRRGRRIGGGIRFRELRRLAREGGR